MKPLYLFHIFRLASSFIHPTTTTFKTQLHQTPSIPSFEELNQQKSEALRTLSSFHDGLWQNDSSAISFSITSDVTAGIGNKFISAPYQTNVSTRLGSSSSNNNNNNGRGGEMLKFVETYSWDQHSNTNDQSGTTSNSSGIGNMFFGRSCPLGNSMDVDSVDGSYSLHTYLETQEDDNDSSTSSTTYALPNSITGIDNKIITSIVEHCLVTNENERCRSFLLYSKAGLYGNSNDASDDNNDQLEKLVRIVICNERKVVANNSDDKLNLLEMVESKPSPSITDDRLEQLSAAIGSNPDLTHDVVRYPVSLMTLSLGPWLGDLVIRDKTYNDLLPTSSTKSVKGFGTPKKSLTNNRQRESGGFAEWVVGVQKIAFQFKWDYGSTVRHCLEFGKSMGSYCKWPISSMGTIHEERMSRRLKPEERSVYIDYDMGTYCGFIVGSVYLKVSFVIQLNDIQRFHLSRKKYILNSHYL